MSPINNFILVEFLQVPEVVYVKVYSPLSTVETSIKPVDELNELIKGVTEKTPPCSPVTFAIGSKSRCLQNELSG